MGNADRSSKSSPDGQSAQVLTQVLSAERSAGRWGLEKVCTGTVWAASTPDLIGRVRRAPLTHCRSLLASCPLARGGTWWIGGGRWRQPRRRTQSIWTRRPGGIPRRARRVSVGWRPGARAPSEPNPMGAPGRGRASNRSSAWGLGTWCAGLGERLSSDSLLVRSSAFGHPPSHI